MAVSSANGERLARAVNILKEFADAHATHMQVMSAMHQKFLAMQLGMAARMESVMGSTAGSTLPAEPAPMAVAAAKTTQRPGPKLSRQELIEITTRQRTISSVFGPMFERQDGHRYQMRMPAPPLTIVGRVTGIEGEPGSLSRGTLWSETDVTADHWGLDPAGHFTTLLIGEGGQANMLLAIWLGGDLAHDGSFRYRFIGFETHMLGSSPKIGDTVCYEMTLERTTVVGDQRLFFYTGKITVGDKIICRMQFSAGLFSEAALAAPAQVNWDPAHDRRKLDGPFELPTRFAAKRSFSSEAIANFAQGKIYECLGAGYERTAAHVRAPRIAYEEGFLLDSIPVFDPEGGPWGRGYLRAEQAVEPDDWYFAAHLPGDPCVPGLLLAEASCQALAFYLTALGCTLHRDAWRFEALQQHRLSIRFSGQVTPQSTRLVYEVFVESLTSGTRPGIIADVICRFEGQIIFHGRRLGLGLVPGWPLDSFARNPYIEAIQGHAGPFAALGGLMGYRNTGTPAARVNDQVDVDYAAMLAFVWGKAQQALGDKGADLDSYARWCRFPGPPFLLVTRVTAYDAEWRVPRAGSWVESEFDVHEDAWFFEHNGFRTMPQCVLLEAVAQTTGWLMLFCTPSADFAERYIRNLDGNAIFFEENLAKDAVLRTRVTLTASSALGETRLYSLRGEGFVDGRRIGEYQTSFGAFTAKALSDQAGLPVAREEKDRMASPSDFYVELSSRPARFFAGSLRLAGPMLLMIDRVTAFQPEGGAKHLGWLRAERDNDPNHYIFKAHFFQDPVQPGSYGIEGMLQLLQFFMIEREMGKNVPQPRFEPIMLGRPVTWKFRGQVLPESKLVAIEVEITEIGADDRGPYAVAQARLWVDGIPVYLALNLGMRIVAAA